MITKIASDGFRRRRFSFSYRLVIVGCGVVYQFAVFGEAGAVAGAIPGVLYAIVFEGAAEVGTARCGGSENSYRRFKGVNGKP